MPTQRPGLTVSLRNIAARMTVIAPAAAEHTVASSGCSVRPAANSADIPRTSSSPIVAINGKARNVTWPVVAPKKRKGSTRALPPMRETQADCKAPIS